MARKKANIHYLYKTTCVITGRWYIGMHSTCNIDDGYMGSGKHSEETKQKMSKPKNIGENNSQYGTCWITKEGVNKKIKKEDLDLYLNECWVKGRK